MLFLIVSIVLFNFIAFIIPKRITRLEIYATALFALFLEYIANYVFDFIQEIYGYFEPGIDLHSFLVVFGIYPAANTIFLNYYPHKSKVITKLIYIFGVSLLSLFYEWLSIKGKYFYHAGWTYGYSLLAYPFLFGVMACNLKLLRRLYRKDRQI